MSDVVKRDLYGLIDKELEAANQKFPLFNSTHEAFAVILEEAEEAKEEAGNLDILMNNFWIGVKENHDPEVLHEELTGIYKTALDLAVEAIQTAAMARKGIISSIDLRAVDQCLSETERRGRIMNQRKAIEAALAEMGITNETQLNDAIRNMKPLNLFLMADRQQERKAS